VSSTDIESKPPGYYNVIEYLVDGGVTRYAVEANCPCGCGHGIWLPITGPGVPKTEHHWTWDGNKAQPTLGPSIKRIGGCAFHGYLQGGAWSSAGDGAPLHPQVYRGGPDHPVEPRRDLTMKTPAPAPAPAPRAAPAPAPAPAPAAAPTNKLPAPTTAPPGHVKTAHLRYRGGRLQQAYQSGNDPGAPLAWVEIEGQPEKIPAPAGGDWPAKGSPTEPHVPEA